MGPLTSGNAMAPRPTSTASIWIDPCPPTTLTTTCCQIPGLSGALAFRFEPATRRASVPASRRNSMPCPGAPNVINPPSSAALGRTQAEKVNPSAARTAKVGAAGINSRALPSNAAAAPMAPAATGRAFDWMGSATRPEASRTTPSASKCNTKACAASYVARASAAAGAFASPHCTTMASAVELALIFGNWTQAAASSFAASNDSR